MRSTGPSSSQHSMKHGRDGPADREPRAPPARAGGSTATYPGRYAPNRGLRNDCSAQLESTQHEARSRRPGGPRAPGPPSPRGRQHRHTTQADTHPTEACARTARPSSSQHSMKHGHDGPAAREPGTPQPARAVPAASHIRFPTEPQHFSIRVKSAKHALSLCSLRTSARARKPASPGAGGGNPVQRYC